MARPLRIEFPGALYHITSRGNEKRDIFLDSRDREAFLELLSLVIERFEGCIIQVQVGLSKSMKARKKMENRKTKILHCKIKPSFFNRNSKLDLLTPAI